MSTNTQELLEKLTRTGMIMRHIDGAGRHGGKFGHGHGHHGPEGEAPEVQEQAAGQAEAEGADHEAPHGHHHGEKCCGHDGHGHGGHGHHKGHGRGGCCHKGHRHGQARVLSMIALKEGINQKDLAYLLGIRPQSLGEMLQKLEERGLVERKKSEADGRAIEVTLTEAGRERAQAIDERRKLAAADIFAVLTDEEQAQLEAILDKLAAEMDKHNPHKKDQQ